MEFLVRRKHDVQHAGLWLFAVDNQTDRPIEIPSLDVYWSGEIPINIYIESEPHKFEDELFDEFAKPIPSNGEVEDIRINNAESYPEVDGHPYPCGPGKTEIGLHETLLPGEAMFVGYKNSKIQGIISFVAKGNIDAKEAESPEPEED